MGQLKGKPSNPTPEQSIGAQEEVEEDHPRQCTGLPEEPVILEMVMGNAVATRDADSGTTNPPNETRNLQKRRQLIRKNTEKLQRTQYVSPEP